MADKMISLPDPGKNFEYVLKEKIKTQSDILNEEKANLIIQMAKPAPSEAELISFALEYHPYYLLGVRMKQIDDELSEGIIEKIK